MPINIGGTVITIIANCITVILSAADLPFATETRGLKYVLPIVKAAIDANGIIQRLLLYLFALMNLMS